MMKTFLLTLDYELYGNGSGDVFKHIIEPTDTILDIAEKYNARLTIFFEVIEYWKLKEEWEKGNKMGYRHNPIEAMENQIKEAYRRGHDVQLHLHPQWVDAIWTEEGWKVNLDKWRLGGYEGEGENSLFHLLQRGKETIERIIADEEYHCTVLRAGGYNIQPSEEVIKAMKTVGLKADTSIYPGGKETGFLSQYDYTSICPSVGMWYCGKKLECIVEDRTEIMEFPIVAFPILRLNKYLSLDRIHSLLRNRKSAKDSFSAKTGGKSGGVLNKLKYFFQYESQTWDYCLFSKSMHRNFLYRISKQADRSVFTLVGHPKSFTNGEAFEYLLKRTRTEYSYLSMSQCLKLL